MQTNQWKKSALKTLTIFAFLGGAFYAVTPKSALAQDMPPVSQTATSQDGPRDAAPRRSSLRPIEGVVKVDPSGRLVGPNAGPGRGTRDEGDTRDPKDGPRGPRDYKGLRDERDLRGSEGASRGPRDHKDPHAGAPDADRGPEDGPRGPKGEPRDFGPGDGPRGPKGGPRDFGPEDGPRGPKGDLHDRGPEDGPRGPRDRGPEGGPHGHRGGKGPHHRLDPRDDNGPRDRGPEDGPQPPADGPTAP